MFLHLQDMMGKQLQMKEKQVGEGVESSAGQKKKVYYIHNPVFKT